MQMAASSTEPLSESFTRFVAEVEPRLRYALTAALGRERGREAAAEALAYGWEHWERLQSTDNPAGYLSRVGRSRGRRRRTLPRFESGRPGRIPDVASALLEALASRTPRTAAGSGSWRTKDPVTAARPGPGGGGRPRSPAAVRTPPAGRSRTTGNRRRR